MDDSVDAAGQEPLAGHIDPIAQSDKARLPSWVRVVTLFSVILAVPAAFACLAMMVQILVDVSGRTFFNRPWQGTLERTAHWWMICIVFAGLGLTQVRHEHVRATAVVELLSDGWQRLAEIVSTALLGLVGVVLAWYTLQGALDSYAIREVTGSSPAIVIWPFLFFMPLGGVALALQSIATIYEISVRVDRPSHAEELI